VAVCVDLVAQGRLDLSYLVTHRFSWDEIPEAFEAYAAQKDRALKGIIAVQAASRTAGAGRARDAVPA
jgi:threonine dehydrogenase-like Zn-dependent dehydrogenase